MADKAQEHPEKAQLMAFGMGKLGPDESETIAQHLDRCADCSETIVNLQDDTFVSLVRSSPSPAPVDEAELKASGSEAAQHDVTVDVASGLTGDDQGTPVELSAELRDHPRYEILELIGRGGMGDVYKAQHKVMNRGVALKVIKPELVRNDAAVERFRREVQAAASLRHANIVTAFDAEQAGDLHFLVMEYVDGDNLDEVVSREGSLSVNDACDCIRQAAEGLQHAHDQGMVHRDIKPHNLMIEKQTGTIVGSVSVVKILDFGLANLANEVAEEALEAADDQAAAGEPNPQDAAPGVSLVYKLTQMGTMMGTPDYIAPEQAKDAHTADIRADIYSLGCTFYTLLTGKVPFGEGSVLEKIKAHSQQEAPPISEFRADVPEEVETVLNKMMAKDPAERYQTPAEVAEAIADCSQDAPRPEKRVSESPAYRKRRPLVLTAVATLFLALLAAATIFYIQTDNGVVRVEVTDPSLKVSIAGQTITAGDGEKPLTIRAGEQKLFVRQNDSDFELVTDSFQLLRGDDVALKVELLPGQVVVSKEGQRFEAKRLPSGSIPKNEDYDPCEYFQRLAGESLESVVRERVGGAPGRKITAERIPQPAGKIRYEAEIDGVGGKIIDNVFVDLKDVLIRGTDAKVVHEGERGADLRMLRYVTPTHNGEVRVTLSSRELGGQPADESTKWLLKIEASEWTKGEGKGTPSVVRVERAGDGWQLYLDGAPLSRDELLARLDVLATGDPGFQVQVEGDVVQPDQPHVLDLMKAIGNTAVGDQNVKFPPHVFRAIIKNSVQRGQRMRKLKEIGVALNQFADANKHFPPNPNGQAFNGKPAFDKDGRPYLSWRVHLLPFFRRKELTELYDKFHLDEAWDSDHNKALLDQMPDVYKTTNGPAKTTLLAIVGEGTAYEGKAGANRESFKDGLLNTAYVVDAGREREAPWTKPEDLTFDREDPIRAFGTSDFGDVFLALMADASVKSVPYDTAPESLRALFTRAAGDTFDLAAKRTTPPPSAVSPVNELKPIGQLEGHRSGISDIVWHPDGERAVSINSHGVGALDPCVRMWNVAEKKLVWEFKRGDYFVGSAVAISPDGRLVAVSPWGVKEHVLLLDADTGDEVRKLKMDFDGVITALDFSPKHDCLAAAARPDEGGMQVWNWKTGETVTLRKRGATNDVKFTPDGGWLLTGGDSLVWRPTKGLLDREKRADGQGSRSKGKTIRQIAISPDGRLWATTDSEGVIELLPCSNPAAAKFGWIRSSPPGTYFAGGTLTFTPDSRHLISARTSGERGDLKSAIGQLTIWDVETMKPVMETHRQNPYQTSLALSPDGRTLLTTGAPKSNKINIWRLPRSVWPADGAAESNELSLLHEFVPVPVERRIASGQVCQPGRPAGSTSTA